MMMCKGEQSETIRFIWESSLRHCVAPVFPENFVWLSLLGLLNCWYYIVPDYHRTSGFIELIGYLAWNYMGPKQAPRELQQWFETQTMDSTYVGKIKWSWASIVSYLGPIIQFDMTHRKEVNRRYRGTCIIRNRNYATSNIGFIKGQGTALLVARQYLTWWLSGCRMSTPLLKNLTLTIAICAIPSSINVAYGTVVTRRSSTATLIIYKQENITKHPSIRHPQHQHPCRSVLPTSLDPVSAAPFSAIGLPMLFLHLHPPPQPEGHRTPPSNSDIPDSSWLYSCRMPRGTAPLGPCQLTH